MKLFLSLNLIFILFYSISSSAKTEVPKLTGPIIDTSGLLSDSAKSKAEIIIRDVYITSGTQLQVLLVDNLENDTIESYSMRVVETYQLGSEKKDNGFCKRLRSKSQARGREG